MPELEARPGGVKIEVSWCGICGSDLHEYMAGPIFVPPSDFGKGWQLSC